MRQQEAALIFITMLWGGTFLILRLAMRDCGPFLFVGLRFLIAAAAVALLYRGRLRGFTRREALAGGAIGVVLAVGYALQSAGLKEIESSRSAFITALYVPIVPVLQWVVLRRPPGMMSGLGAGLAFAGLVALAGPGALTLSLGRGDVLTILSAFAIATEIVLIGLFAGGSGDKGTDSRRLTLAQLAAGGAFALVGVPVAGEALPSSASWIWLGYAVGLGLFSAGVQLVMNWAQKTVPPTRAAIIYAGEPVWGGLVGWMAGDTLTLSALAGAALIVGGVAVSALEPARLVAFLFRRTGGGGGTPA